MPSDFAELYYDEWLKKAPYVSYKLHNETLHQKG